MKIIRNAALGGLLSATAIALLTAQAAQADDNESDMAAVAAATVSFGDAVGVAENASKGKAVEAELEMEDGAVVFEVETLGPDGRQEVTVDARTGSVLEMEAEKNDEDDGDDDDGEMDDD